MSGFGNRLKPDFQFSILDFGFSIAGKCKDVHGGLVDFGPLTMDSQVLTADC